MLSRRCQFINSKRLLATKSGSYSAYWMPFTANSRYKGLENKFLLDRADGMYYYTPDDKPVIDATGGLWCSNAGHNHPLVSKRIIEQASKLDYAPSFQLSHSLAFEYCERLAVEIAPEGLGKIFLTMCGSTAVDSALKIALSYHRARGQAQRVRFIGRERSYHGVGFGGISVGGILANRLPYSSNLMPHVDHLPHTFNLEHNAFSHGLPKWGAHLADELERLVALHGAETIAGVIVEPVAGSTGVLPPPIGYLEKLRAICTKHNLLLIFDEVITGFGRLGSPTAAHHFGVTPDMITVAKGMTNAAVPAGAVFVKNSIYDTVVGAAASGAIELLHGYTYSGHPLACAAGMGALDAYAEGNLFANAAKQAVTFERLLHSLRDSHAEIVDIRNIGLMGAIEFKPVLGAPGKRGFELFSKAYESGLLVRVTGDTVALSPPLIVSEVELDIIFSKLRHVIKGLH